MEILAYSEGSFVVLDGNQEQQLSVDEFVEIYGEDALPSNKPAGKVIITEEQVEEMAKREEDAINEYYATMKRFLDAVGYHQGFLKVVDKYGDGNALENSKPSEVITKKRKVPLSSIDQELNRMNNVRWKLFNKLNEKAEAIGLPPVERGRMNDILKFLEEQPRREFLRNQIRRLQPKGDLRSLDDLIKKRSNWEKIQAEKKGGNNR